jgi:hypothetical protein
LKPSFAARTAFGRIGVCAIALMRRSETVARPEASAGAAHVNRLEAPSGMRSSTACRRDLAMSEQACPNRLPAA